MTCWNFRPDHNGECLNCDEWADVHRPLRRGEFVTITIRAWTITAMVGLASENGLALIVLFDGAAPIAGGLALGMLALSGEDDGTYVDLMSRTPVTVTRRDQTDDDEADT